MVAKGKRLTVRNELRERLPGRCSKADYGRSAVSALRLNCVECMGGNSQMVHTCETYDCFLWPYRVNKVNLDERPEDAVPSMEEYEGRLDEWWKSRGLDRDVAITRLAEARESRGSGDADPD